MDMVTDIETAIKYLPFFEKEFVRRKSLEILKSNHQPVPKNAFNFEEVVKNLMKKDCYYMKADKGNAIVIMDKPDYDSQMTQLISSGQYSEVKNPLPKMIRETSRALNDYIDEISKATKTKLLISNPRVPVLYGLPKIHKPNGGMRPIVSNINSPSERLAKWLVSEFQNLPPFPTFSVKNSIEFVKKVETTILSDDETMCSFDVSSLFPNVPLKETFHFLESWLCKQPLSDRRKKMYMELIKLCMSHSFFTFRGKYYKQTFGTAMGNAAAPFLSSDVFLGSLEWLAKDESWFPRIWIRYVDDVFAVVKTNSILNVLENLNKMFPSIQFTHEIERNGGLPFLDLLVKRRDGKLNFSIYRKPTHTQRYITADSNHCFQHKMAAFNSMLYRLVNIPMSKEDYSTELKFIKNTAQINGYSNDLIVPILNKHIRAKKITDITTLMNISSSEVKRIGITYHPPCFGKFQKMFKEINKQMIPVTINKLKNNICMSKDRCDNVKKSGVYMIKCSCEKCYVGQSSRAIIERWKDHNKHIAKNEYDKSSVAAHILDNLNHELHLDNFKLIKMVTNKQKLDAWESLYIHKYSNNLLNNGEPPISSSLFSLCN